MVRDQANKDGGRSGAAATAATALPTQLERPRPVAEVKRAALVSPLAQPPAASIQLLPPKTRLGRYFIVRHIKSGGMGAVYRAEDPETGQVVAIKTMVAEVGVKSEAYARFLGEVKAACTVRHRNVIQIFGFDVHAGMPYLIMEYLRGQGLNDLIARGPLPIDRASDIVAAVCSAMGAVHDHHIVHRDLKPSNIFLADSDEGEQVKVLDFGVSKLRTARDMTASNTIIGSVHYMSPEQARGLEVDARSDQFAVGVVLYECLTGQRPHAGETLFEVSDAIIHGRRRPVRALRPDIAPALEAILSRALDRDPARRFPSVRELGGALLPYASAEGQRQLSDLLTKGSLKMRRARSSAPMPAAWFKTNGSAAVPQPIVAAETRLLPTAPLPRNGATAGLAPGSRSLGETRSLPDGFCAPAIAAPPSPARARARRGTASEILPEGSAEWRGERAHARGSRDIWIGLGAMLVAMVGGGWWFTARKSKHPAPSTPATVSRTALKSEVGAAPRAAAAEPTAPVTAGVPGLALSPVAAGPAPVVRATPTAPAPVADSASTPDREPSATSGGRSRDRRRNRHAQPAAVSPAATPRAERQSAGDAQLDDGILIIE